MSYLIAITPSQSNGRVPRNSTLVWDFGVTVGPIWIMHFVGEYHILRGLRHPCHPITIFSRGIVCWLEAIFVDFWRSKRRTPKHHTSVLDTANIRQIRHLVEMFSLLPLVQLLPQVDRGNRIRTTLDVWHASE